MSNTPIELKGSSFTLSVVHLHEAEPKVIHQALEDKIAQAPAFLKHAPVVLNVSALEDPVNWSAMRKGGFGNRFAGYWRKWLQRCAT